MRFVSTAFFFLIFFSCQSQQEPSILSSEIQTLITEEQYPNIDGILVAQNDSLLIEEYFNGYKKDQLHETRSSFKSITSLLAGIAIDQGLFQLEDEIGQYITEWQDDPRGKITIKNLLEMKSGLACEGFFGIGPDCESEMWETDDWLQYILSIPMRHEPGLNWAYTSIEPEIVGIIISRASDKTLIDFTDEYLFGPLGIKDCKWHITPDGRGYAAGSSYMKPSDMLKIAQLVVNDGKWKGRQVISSEWIEASTHCEIDVEMSFVRFARTKNAKYHTAKYGYYWYREVLAYKDVQTEVLFASGNGGQYMMVLEDYNAAVVFTGSNFGNWRGKLPFDILLKYIIPKLEKV